MAGFRSFEEIEAWQEGRILVKEIYAISNCGSLSKDFALRDQLRRGSLSIISNIAEGFERGGTPEFIRFLNIAKGSAGEVRAQLYVAWDLGYLEEDNFKRLSNSVVRVSRMLSRLISYLRESIH